MDRRAFLGLCAGVVATVAGVRFFAGSRSETFAEVYARARDGDTIFFRPDGTYELVRSKHPIRAVTFSGRVLNNPFLTPSDRAELYRRGYR